jgi:NAD(P)-dependent dehydrogenase (short-subunit alcohol dehydrogenase family)
MAKETAARGVRVFALTPGIVRTALTEALLQSEDGRRWLPELGRLVADGRAWVEAERVGDAIVELAAGRADALSGRWIHAEEDLDALVEKAHAIRERELRVLRLRS